jgi:hypothetical protein
LIGGETNNSTSKRCRAIQRGQWRIAALPLRSGMLSPHRGQFM